MEIITKTKAKEFFFNNYNPEIKINVSATAKSLKVSRVTIYSWMKEFNEK